MAASDKPTPKDGESGSQPGVADVSDDVAEVRAIVIIIIC